MAGWYFAGPDSESATDLERNELSRQINSILSRLGTGWMIQVEAIRVPTVDYPTPDQCYFPDPVTRAIDAERRTHFGREQGHFESKHAIILTYRPLESKKTALAKYIYSDEASRKKSYADTVLFVFRDKIREEIGEDGHQITLAQVHELLDLEALKRSKRQAILFSV